MQAIRAETSIPNTFVIGIKLNAGDYASDPLDQTRALAHVRSIAEWKNVDFLEIRCADVYCSCYYLIFDSTFQRRGLRITWYVLVIWSSIHQANTLPRFYEKR